MTTTIHIVDDDEAFRKAITRLLVAHGYEVAVYDSAEKFLASSIGGRACLLLDVRMPGLSGLQAQAHLAQRGDLLPVIFLTGHGDIPMSVHAIKAGAQDFLTKPVPARELIAAIEAALRQYDCVCKQHSQTLQLKKRYLTLTPREREVFKEVAAGKLNKLIAAELGTVERTVKAHRQRVMKKMEAASLADLVQMANQLGI